MRLTPEREEEIREFVDAVGVSSYQNYEHIIRELLAELDALRAERVELLHSLGCDEHGVSIEGCYEGTRQDWIDRAFMAEGERDELRQQLATLKCIRCHCAFDGETLKEECAFHKALRVERDTLALKVGTLQTELYNAD